MTPSKTLVVPEWRVGDPNVVLWKDGHPAGLNHLGMAPSPEVHTYLACNGGGCSPPTELPYVPVPDLPVGLGILVGIAVLTCLHAKNRRS